MEMALRDLSVSSMKHPPLAKQSASYTTLEMPTDIVIIPVGRLSCGGPADASSSAHPVGVPLATDVDGPSSGFAQNGHDPAQNGRSPQVTAQHLPEPRFFIMSQQAWQAGIRIQCSLCICPIPYAMPGCS